MAMIFKVLGKLGSAVAHIVEANGGRKAVGSVLSEEARANGLHRLETASLSDVMPRHSEWSHGDDVLNHLATRGELSRQALGRGRERSVAVKSLVPSQPDVDPDKIAGMLAHGIRPDGGLPKVVRYRGQNYVVDGHHRIGAHAISGAETVAARVRVARDRLRTGSLKRGVVGGKAKKLRAENGKARPEGTHDRKAGWWVQRSNGTKYWRRAHK